VIVSGDAIRNVIGANLDPSPALGRRERGGVEGVDLLGGANAKGDVGALDDGATAGRDPEDGLGPCSPSLPKPADPSTGSISRRMPSGSSARS